MLPLIIITASRPHILLASYDTSPHTHSTTSPHKNLNYLYINIRKIITLHDNTTTKSIKTGRVHEYIGLHLFFYYYSKVIYSPVRLNRHSISDQKTIQGLNPKHTDQRCPWNISDHHQPASWAHWADPSTLNCSWMCGLLVVCFAPSLHRKISSEHMWRRWTQVQAGGAWMARLRVCGGPVLGKSSTSEGPWFTFLIIMGIKM